MTDFLGRMRRMTWDEVAWRVRRTIRTNADRVNAWIRPPQWHRADLVHALNPETLDTGLRIDIDRGDWHAAHRALARTIRGRAARFPLDPATLPDVREEILSRWPDAGRRAAARADHILSGVYNVLGYRSLSFTPDGGAVDWHFDPIHERRAPMQFWADVPFLNHSVGDHKIIWELNRQQHWLVLGRALWLTRQRRYGWALVEQLESWMRANPPLMGINWASMLELAFRSIAWTWALHVLLADTDEDSMDPARRPWLVDMFIGLNRQLTHIERNLSHYYSPNTHLTGEALALYTVGVALPELARSAHWTQIGREILLRELDRQVCADGGHAERSTHYHRYTLDFYLLALLVAECVQDLPVVSRFTDAVTRMADFARAMADDRGRLPLIGDDDGGLLWPIDGRDCNDIRDSLALAAVVLARADFAPWGVPEEVFWIAGATASEFAPLVEAHRGETPPVASRVLAATGFVVVRDERRDHLVFDAGPHGYLNAGHAHADALSVTLTLGDRPFLIDPGTCTYTMEPALRDRMRDTVSHNTVTIDGRRQSVPAGPFHWSSRTDAHLDASRQNQHFDWAEAAHDGYGDVRHRRHVLRFGGGSWLIVDEVIGGARHEAVRYWHFDPAWAVRTDESGRLHAVHDDGASVWLLHDAIETLLIRGDERLGLGWYSPVYGTLVPTWTVRFSNEAPAPFWLATWITPDCGHGPQVGPFLDRPVADADRAGSSPIAVRLVDGDVVQVTVLRPGERKHRESRNSGTREYQTDARMFHYRTEAGRLAALHVADATHVLALRDGWLSIAADQVIADLSVSIQDDVVALWSSSPPARLRLQGQSLVRARVVRLNGRESSAERERNETLVITGVAWAEPRAHQAEDSRHVCVE
jgi:Heparinase II/III-like protein/Heparinase II/III N-terminus